MRRRHVLRRILAGLAGGLLLLFAALQTGEGQRALFDLVASAVSGDGRTVRLEGPSGFFPTDLRLVRVEVADGAGVWLTAEDVRVHWSFLALLGGRLDVHVLRAGRLSLERTPQAPPRSAPSGSGSDDGGLPLPVSVEALAIDELRLGTPLAGVESRWRLSASARLEGIEDNNSLSLDASRSDGRSGRLSLQAAHDGARGVLNARGEFEEGEGGMLAALLGRPDLPRTAGRFQAELTGRGGDARLSVEAGDALGINGTVSLRSDNAGRHVALAMQITGGRIPDPVWKAALAQPASVEADILLDPSGAIEVRAFSLKAAPLEATAGGRYAPADKRLQLRLSVTGGDVAMLAAIVPGATWRNVRLDVQASGTMAAIDATLSLRAAALATGEASARDVDLTATVQGADPAVAALARGDLKGTLGEVRMQADGRELAARDVRLAAAGRRDRTGGVSLTSFDLGSSLLGANGAGTLGANGALAANATIDVPDLAVLAAVIGWPVAGTGQLKLQVAGTRDRPAATLDATLRNGVVQSVPPALLTPELRATAAGSIDPAQRWRLERASVSSEAITVTASGAGTGANGTLDATVALPRLEALDARYAGTLRSDIHVEARDARRTVRLRAEVAQAKVDGTDIERLALDAGLTLRDDSLDATLQLDGSGAGQPLRAQGRISAVAGERLLIPEFNASLGSTSLAIRDLAVDRSMASGSARLLVEDLKQLGALAGQKLAGRLEVNVVPDGSAGEGKLKLSLRGTGLALDETAIGTLNADATIADPLGRAAFEASVAAGALRGVAGFGTLSLKASGDRDAIAATVDATGPGVGVHSAFKARREGDATVVDLDSLRGTYAGRPFALAGATRLRQSGERLAVEPLQLNIAGGSVRVAGAVDAANSELGVDITPLRLAELAALAGQDMPLEGMLQAQVQVRGARANPEVAATFTMRDARLRRVGMASVPAASLTGKATLRDRALSAEARLAVGASALAIAATGQMPRQGAPGGRLTVNGPVDLAMFASLLGPDIQQVAGRAQFDVALSVSGGRPAGSGTVRLEAVRMALPSEGLVLSQGSGLIRLAEDRVIIERFAFPAVGKGDVALSGEVRFDPKFALPMDLRLETRRARLLARRDLIAELTSSLRLHGSVGEGLTAAGQIRIDRAEINANLGDGTAAVPSVAVREVGKGAPKAVKSAPSRPLALDLKVSAPQAIFVRGKGLDAEVGGELTVTGTSAKPIVIGGLSMRRGTYTLLGKPLKFSRGVVTFTNADRIEPVLDMLATTRGSSVTVEVKVTGTANNPKIELSSSPTLPQDEIIAHLLFDKGASQLGPGELVQVANAVAELSGVGSSMTVVDSVRRALGLDRLSIGQGGGQQGSSSSGSGGGLSGAGVGGGRYIGRGVYLGGRQGLQGDSRGVVQIEVIPHVKIEAEVGTNSTGRAGVALEYDY